MSDTASVFSEMSNREAFERQHGSTSAQMPRYRCHKEVWALKIKSIHFDIDRAKADGSETDGSAIIIPVDQGYGAFRVDARYVDKHKPEAGGYYVVYKDGYKSFSPAEAFEDGYARI